MRVFLFAIILFLYTSASAQDYYNIKGLFGEKAPGMGGAFTAISDDVSGMYYNPAGLSFSDKNYISINASSYKMQNVYLKDMFGPQQDYDRASKNYLPNFIGIVKAYGNWNFGFSVINSVSENFDQADQINLPLFEREITRINATLREENFEIFGGPSLSYKFSNRFSLGFSFHYLYSSSSNFLHIQQEYETGSISHVTQQEKKKAYAFTPIVGFQYMLIDKLSLGLSLRHQKYTTGNYSSRNSVNTSIGMDNILIISEGNKNFTTSAINQFVILSSPEIYELPNLTTIRSGLAYFFSTRFLLSFDLIYTSSFKKNIFRYDYSAGFYSISNTNKNELYRESTLNYALGTEIFLSEFIAFRAGFYTNNSNNTKFSWIQGALKMIYEDTAGLDGMHVDSNIFIKGPGLRDEYVNLKGYTFGLGFYTGGNSISISYVREVGRGISAIPVGKLPQIVVVNYNSFYLTATSSY